MKKSREFNNITLKSGVFSRTETVYFKVKSIKMRMHLKAVLDLKQQGFIYLQFVVMLISCLNPDPI